MAELFLARQSGEGRFERLVVIKRILPELAGDKRFIEMFLEEARIAALLEHPNVVPIYDLGRVGETYFIAMPYVIGLTLKSLLEEATRLRVPITREITCELVRQALLGMHYAHERTGLDGKPLGLVHRDVSPSNLMINEQGRVMLLDFGIASVADTDSSATGTLRGKLAYMSPEQVRTEIVDRRSDLFSLGIIFWELLVGKRLFQRRSDIEVINAIAHDPILDALEARPNLPLQLVEVLRGALHRDPEQRFPTADAMREALEVAVVPLGLEFSQAALSDLICDNFSAILKRQAKTLQEARKTEATSEGPTLVEMPDTGSLARSTPQPAPAGRGKGLLFAGAVLLLLSLLGAGVWYGWFRAPPLEGPPLRFGMIPYLPEEVLRSEWSPLLRHIEEKMGRPVKLVMTHSYDQMVQALIDGKVDVADLSAYPFILARRRDPGTQPLAVGLSAHQKTYECYLVVQRGSSARALKDLRGGRICYVDRTSTSGYLMPRIMLRKAGHDPDHFFSAHQFSGDHYRALRDLLAGRCDVAALASSSYLAAGQMGITIAEARILAISSSLPHGVYTASSKIPTEVTRKLKKILLTLDVKQTFGRERLGNDLAITGFAPVDLSAFRELEQEVAHVQQGPTSAPASQPSSRPSPP
jgi:phosphate/phosphite/phosphonate ABC transporter binding protein